MECAIGSYPRPSARQFGRFATEQLMIALSIYKLIILLTLNLSSKPQFYERIYADSVVQHIDILILSINYITSMCGFNTRWIHCKLPQCFTYNISGHFANTSLKISGECTQECPLVCHSCYVTSLTLVVQ